MPNAHLTPNFHEAAGLGKIDIVKRWLNKGIDVNSISEISARTALIESAISGHEDVGRLLLDRGAHVDAWDEECWTPLAYAIYNRNFEFAQILIDHGANPYHMRFWTRLSPDEYEEIPLDSVIKNTAGAETWAMWCAFRLSKYTPTVAIARSCHRL